MKNKAKSVSMIGGADGPTSVFIAGKADKVSMLERIKRFHYKKKRSKVEKKVTANPHTLEEVIRYLQNKYGAVEVSRQSQDYVLQRKNLKASLVMQHKPELLGDMAEMEPSKGNTEKEISGFLEQLRQRTEKAENISEEEFPLEFHIYKIEIKEIGEVEICMEKIWNNFGISYSGKNDKMKELKRIAKDIYLYYGVTKEDIQSRSMRYSALVTMLCE